MFMGVEEQNNGESDEGLNTQEPRPSKVTCSKRDPPTKGKMREGRGKHGGNISISKKAERNY